MFKNLSKQAKYALVGYVILIVALFLPYNITDDENDKNYYLKDRIIYVLVLLIPVFISVFTINCMVKGTAATGCGTLSWIHAIAVFVWGLLVLFSALYLTKNGTKLVKTEAFDTEAKKAEKEASYASLNSVQGEENTSELLK